MLIKNIPDNCAVDKIVNHFKLTAINAIDTYKFPITINIREGADWFFYANNDVPYCRSAELTWETFNKNNP